MRPNTRRLLPLRRFVVQDTSMRPAFEPGDRVLVWQWSRRFGPGDVIVFIEPDRYLTTSVKRVASLHTDGAVNVRGDNLNVSRDSREYGPVPRARIFGRVVYRYLPGPRRGRL
jgi:nickel-type superoxide dismutase maturation protease